MATRSTGRTQKLPGSGLPVSRNPESNGTASSLQRIESDAKRWGSLGLPHGPVHITHHSGIHFSLQSRSRLKVLCGIVYATTIDVGNRAMSKLKVESSNKSTGDQTRLDPFVQAPSTSILPSFSSTFLNRTRFGSTDIAPCSSEPGNQFHRLPQISSASLPPSTSGFCSRGSDEVSEINSSFEPISRFEDFSLMPGVNRDGREIVAAENFNSSGDRVPSDSSGGKEVDDKNLPILSDELFGSYVQLEGQTHLDPFVQAPSTSSLPSFSSTFFNRTRLESSDVTPCSLEPVNQFPLYFDHPTSASFSSSTSGFCSRGSGLTEINYSESDSHFEDCRLMPGESRAGREMEGMISCSEYPTKYAEMSKTEMNKETTCENRTDSGLMISPNNLGGPDKQHKRVSSSFDDRENVVLKIQKTPSPVQIAIDDSDSTPPTSLSSSGHPISTQLGDDNPISSESGDIPLTDENLQLLRRYQGTSDIRYFHFFKNQRTSPNATCLLCNRQVKTPPSHIELHLRSGQSLQELLDCCCNTGKVPRFTLTAKMITYVVKMKFEEQIECPICFVRSDEGWAHFGEHIRRAHFKDADRSFGKLDSLVKKCFANVSLDESGVTRFSCTICRMIYHSRARVPPGLYRHIAECLRQDSEKQLVDRVEDYENFLEECKKVKSGECPKCRNKIETCLWAHYEKCQANYYTSVE